MIDEPRFKALAESYDLRLSPEQLRAFSLYAGLLGAWNEKVNLTGITAPEQVEEKHFLDCLLLAALPRVAGRLVDVGSGAGFPGLVVKLYRPDVAVTLLEPTGKKVLFLQDAVQKLGIKVDIVKERAEEAARKAWREGFDIATARAVAPLNILCEYCLPLVKCGGFFISMKGSNTEAMPQNALGRLGGRHVETRSFTLPGGAARTLLVFEKTAPTPQVYPRAGGVIAKRPL